MSNLHRPTSSLNTPNVPSTLSHRASNAGTASKIESTNEQRKLSKQTAKENLNNSNSKTGSGFKRYGTTMLGGRPMTNSSVSSASKAPYTSISAKVVTNINSSRNHMDKNRSFVDQSKKEEMI